jgi:hypothetical protein
LYGSNAELGNRRTARSASTNIDGSNPGSCVGGHPKQLIGGEASIFKDTVYVDTVTDLGPAEQST